MPNVTLPAPAPRNQPVHEVRLGGIKAAIWQNETQTGVRYNVTFERLYKDGDQWKSTESFGRDDLLLLGKVADLAHSWIMAPEMPGAVATPPVGRPAPVDLKGKRLPKNPVTTRAGE